MCLFQKFVRVTCHKNYRQSANDRAGFIEPCRLACLPHHRCVIQPSEFLGKQGISWKLVTKLNQQLSSVGEVLLMDVGAVVVLLSVVLAFTNSPNSDAPTG